MAKRLPRYFWETNDFCIALKRETAYGQEVLDSVLAIVDQMEQGKAVIITSSIIVSEVLPSRQPPGAYDRFQAWLRLPNLIPRDVDIAVATKAAEIREVLLAARDKAPICEKCGRAIDARRWADIIFTATAVVMRNDIDEIQSVDPHFQAMLDHSGSGLRAVEPNHPSVRRLAGSLFEGTGLSGDPDNTPNPPPTS